MLHTSHVHTCNPQTLCKPSTQFYYLPLLVLKNHSPLAYKGRFSQHGGSSMCQCIVSFLRQTMLHRILLWFLSSMYSTFKFIFSFSSSQIFFHASLWEWANFGNKKILFLKVNHQILSNIKFSHRIVPLWVNYHNDLIKEIMKQALTYMAPISSEHL